MWTDREWLMELDKWLQTTNTPFEVFNTLSNEPSWPLVQWTWNEDKERYEFTPVPQEGQKRQWQQRQIKLSIHITKYQHVIKIKKQILMQDRKYPFVVPSDIK